MPITYTSGEQVEVYRFSIPVTIGVPLLALRLVLGWSQALRWGRRGVEAVG